MLQIRPIGRNQLGSLAILGLVSAGLAGCLDSTDDYLEPFTFSQPHGFVAEIKFENGSEGIVNFSGPYSVPDVDHKEFSAYKLERTGFWPDGIPNDLEFKQTWYLDADYRVVAHVGNCGHGFVGPCDRYDNWMWGRQGQLNPMGIGFPGLALKGELKDLAGNNVTSVQWEAQNAQNHGLEMVVYFPDIWGRGEPTKEIFNYEPGRLLPDSAEWSVVDYHSGAPLAEADRLDLPRGIPGHREWTGLMFEGENEDPFGLGFTHREIAEAVDSTLRKKGDACVKGYILNVRDPDEEQLFGLVEVPVGEDLLARGIITLWKDGEEQDWEFEIRQDRLDGTTRIETSVFSTGGKSHSCDDLYRSPWPGLTFEEGLEHANKFDISGQSEVRMFNHFVATPGALNREPSAGLHTWWFGYRPNWVAEGSGGTIDNYEIGFSPTEDLPLRGAKIHPNDIGVFFRE